MGASDYPIRAVGRVTGEQEQLDHLLTKKEQNRTDRFTHLAVLAAEQALHDAAIQITEENDSRAGVCIGVGLAGLPAITHSLHDLAARGIHRVSPYLIPQCMTSAPASYLSIRYRLRASALTVSTACSSGSDALGLAWQRIMTGQADIMLAGGTESLIEPITIGGFGNMRALSRWQGDPTHASRPFNRNRDGFVLAEGAGMLLLESYEHAQQRGAHIYVELAGYGQSADACHMTAPDEQGRGAQAAITTALQAAKCEAESIGYINAHGTSTPLNDRIEAQVLNTVFPHRPFVSSTKSMTGHMLGAAGGVEAGITALAVHHDLLPPTRNLIDPDPDCDVNHVTTAIAHSADAALSVSFGFGGANAALVFKRL